MRYLCIFFLFFTLLGCDKDTIYIWDSAKVKAQKKAAIEQSKKDEYEKSSLAMNNFNIYTKTDLIALLSLKYSISSNTIVNIIKDLYRTEYMSESEIINHLETYLTFKSDEEIINASNNEISKLNQISQKYSISSTTLSSLLFDYEIWVKTHN